MQTESYHGFRVDHEPETGLAAVAFRGRWFNVYERDTLSFRVRMRVGSSSLSQSSGRVDSSVLQRLRIVADDHARRVGRTLLCVIDGTDTARILRAHGYA